MRESDDLKDGSNWPCSARISAGYPLFVIRDEASAKCSLSPASNVECFQAQCRAARTSHRRRRALERFARLSDDRMLSILLEYVCVSHNFLDAYFPHHLLSASSRTRLSHMRKCSGFSNIKTRLSRAEKRRTSAESLYIIYVSSLFSCHFRTTSKMSRRQIKHTETTRSHRRARQR